MTMFESEEGYLTGSIDVSKLDSHKPKSDEAKAQLEALKAENQAGRDALARQAEATAVAYPDQDEPAPDNRDVQGKSVPADDSSDDTDLDGLRSEAEAAGVKVDRRWGEDRLRDELAAASKGKGKR
jgi:hypothetical protein